MVDVVRIIFFGVLVVWGLETVDNNCWLLKTMRGVVLLLLCWHDEMKMIVFIVFEDN